MTSLLSFPLSPHLIPQAVLFPIIEILLELTVESRAVVRENAERSLGHFAQFPPELTLYKTVLYDNVNVAHRPYSHFPFCLHSFVYKY